MTERLELVVYDCRVHGSGQFAETACNPGFEHPDQLL